MGDPEGPLEERGFLAEYWIWILVPILMILLVVLYVMWTAEEATDYQYGIY